MPRRVDRKAAACIMVLAVWIIAQPMRAIGEGTVRLLLQILSDDSVAPASATLPHALVMRDSTAPPNR